MRDGVCWGFPSPASELDHALGKAQAPKWSSGAVLHSPWGSANFMQYWVGANAGTS